MTLQGYKAHSLGLYGVSNFFWTTPIERGLMQPWAYNNGDNYCEMFICTHAYTRGSRSKKVTHLQQMRRKMVLV